MNVIVGNFREKFFYFTLSKFWTPGYPDFKILRFYYIIKQASAQI
jgi:hypothetical protein